MMDQIPEVNISPWIWIGFAIFWFLGLFMAFALCKTASDADDQAARMYADQCPDEIEP